MIDRLHQVIIKNAMSELHLIVLIYTYYMTRFDEICVHKYFFRIYILYTDYMTIYDEICYTFI